MLIFDDFGGVLLFFVIIGNVSFWYIFWLICFFRMIFLDFDFVLKNCFVNIFFCVVKFILKIILLFKFLFKFKVFVVRILFFFVKFFSIDVLYVCFLNIGVWLFMFFIVMFIVILVDNGGDLLF